MEQDQNDQQTSFDSLFAPETPPTETNTETPSVPEGQADPNKFVSVEQYNELKQNLDNVRAEMVRNSRPTVQEQFSAPQPQYAPQQDSQDVLAKLKEQLGQEIYTDPGAALLKAAQLGSAIAVQQMQSQYAPAAQGLTDVVVENFMASKTRDPLYAQVADRFQQKIASIPRQQLAGIPANQLRVGLEEIYKTAKGEWADEAYAGAQKRGRIPQPQTFRDEPPNYAGGSSRSGNLGGGRAVSAGAGLNQNTIDIAKELGMTDDDLAAMAADDGN